MTLEEKFQQKLKDLETVRVEIQKLEEQKQKLAQQFLEVQGAAKQLLELVNEKKAAEQPEQPTEEKK